MENSQTSSNYCIYCDVYFHTIDEFYIHRKILHGIRQNSPFKPLERTETVNSNGITSTSEEDPIKRVENPEKTKKTVKTVEKYRAVTNKDLKFIRTDLKYPDNQRLESETDSRIQSFDAGAYNALKLYTHRTDYEKIKYKSHDIGWNIDQINYLPEEWDRFVQDSVSKSTSKKTRNSESPKRVHTGELDCDLCQESLLKITPYAKYTGVIDGPRPFKCDICTETFLHTCQLAYHQRESHDIRSYECEKCNKRFNMVSALRVHKRIHERPFACELCAKIFDTLDNLRLHQRVHTAEWRHQCDVCSKRFNSVSRLNSHRRFHARERTNPSDIFSQSFNQPPSFRTDKRTRSYVNL